MIVAFSPNPALERVALVEKFQTISPPDEGQKPMRVSTFAGGAGIRAANVIRLLGGDVLFLGFVGGHLGALMADSLDKQDIPHVLTPIASDTRGDFLLLDRDKGVITEIPENPPAFTDAEADKLLRSLDRHLGRASLLLLADSQQDSHDPAIFARAFVQAQTANVPVLADLSGEALDAVINAGGGDAASSLWMVRVNLKTFQKRTERSLQHDSAIIEEGRGLLARGVQNVVVTLGEEGALLVNNSGAWRVKAPVVSHFNPTGSGETLSGAVAMWWAKTGDVVEAVRVGCAAASVNVTHDEPGWATPGEVNVLLPRTVAGPVIIR